MPTPPDSTRKPAPVKDDTAKPPGGAKSPATLAHEQARFTSEGAPPPGKVVSNVAPVTPGKAKPKP
jgi:hypothetical protein